MYAYVYICPYINTGVNEDSSRGGGVVRKVREVLEVDDEGVRGGGGGGGDSAVAFGSSKGEL